MTVNCASIMVDGHLKMTLLAPLYPLLTILIGTGIGVGHRNRSTPGDGLDALMDESSNCLPSQSLTVSVSRMLTVNGPRNGPLVCAPVAASNCGARAKNAP